MQVAGETALAGPFDWLGTIQKADNILQRFAQLKKCKFCDGMIPQKAVFCEVCGKSQI